MQTQHAQDVLEQLRLRGFNLYLMQGSVVRVDPASHMTDDERTLIRVNKKALIALLSSAPSTTTTEDSHVLEEIDIGTVRPLGLSPFFLAASLALDRKILASDAKLAASQIR